MATRLLLGFPVVRCVSGAGATRGLELKAAPLGIFRRLQVVDFNICVLLIFLWHTQVFLSLGLLVFLVLLVTLYQVDAAEFPAGHFLVFVHSLCACVTKSRAKAQESTGGDTFRQVGSSSCLAT